MEYCPKCGSGEYANGVCNFCGYVYTKPESRKVKPRRRRKS